MAIEVQSIDSSCVDGEGVIEIQCISTVAEIITVNLYFFGTSIVSATLSSSLSSSFNAVFTGVGDGSFTVEVIGSSSGSEPGTEIIYSDGDFVSVECFIPCDLTITSVSKTNDVNAQGIGSVIVNATSSFPRQYKITGPISYPLQSSNVFNGLIPAAYVVRVEDSNGCFDEENVTIENTPCSLTLEVYHTDESGFDLNNGTAVAEALGPNAPFTYNLDGAAYASPNEWSGIAPGVHTVYVKDSANCIVSQNFTVAEFAEPPQPTECFDPEIKISEAIPYKIVLKHCNPLDDTETLYSEVENCGSYSPCYFQPLTCNDVLTLQIYYLDQEFNTVPVLKIYNFLNESLIYTVSFTSIGSGYYKIEKNLAELPDLCGKKVYLEINSYSAYFDEEYYSHAKSENLHVSNYHNCNLLIEYWNNSNYNEIIYEGTGYINNLRLNAILDEDDAPQEMEVYTKSNGEKVKINETVTEVWQLEVDYSPFYIHKKIALALSHDHVRINGVEYVKEEPYSFERVKNFALRKGLGKLSAKSYQSKNLIK